MHAALEEERVSLGLPGGRVSGQRGPWMEPGVRSGPLWLVNTEKPGGLEWREQGREKERESWRASGVRLERAVNVITE